MNVKIKVASIFVLFIMVVSCATTTSTSPKKSSTLPAKYNLVDLKSVNEIMRVKKSSFEEVDNQSVILKANRGEYYLLVLREPIDPYISKKRTIGVESTESSIPARIGRIYIRGDRDITAVGISYTDYIGRDGIKLSICEAKRIGRIYTSKIDYLRRRILQ